MPKTQWEVGANYHNTLEADCRECYCNGRDCHPDEPEQFDWDCNEFKTSE